MGWQAAEMAALQLPATGMVEVRRRHPETIKNRTMTTPTAMTETTPAGDYPKVV